MKLGLYVDIENGGVLPNDQFAFIEENVQTLLVPEQDDAAFERRLEIARRLEKPIYAANRFIPAELRIVGPDVNIARLHRWAEVAFLRAEKIGLKILVWGSGAARKVPDNWSHGKAREQFLDAVGMVAPIAERHDVTIVIEPVCHYDSNLVQTLAEGADIVESTGHPAVRLLADFWHTHHNGEPASEIERFGHLLEHVHLSEFGLDRAEPGRRGDDFAPYLQSLKAAGYDKGLVIESNWTDVQNEPRRGLADLRRQMQTVGLS